MLLWLSLPINTPPQLWFIFILLTYLEVTPFASHIFFLLANVRMLVFVSRGDPIRDLFPLSFSLNHSTHMIILNHLQNCMFYYRFLLMILDSSISTFLNYYFCRLILETKHSSHQLELFMELRSNQVNFPSASEFFNCGDSHLVSP